jgi:hypothetical protein
MGPVGDPLAGICDAGERRLIGQLVAHPPVEAFCEGILRGLARRLGELLDLGPAATLSTAFEVSSAPFSLAIMPGLPRTVIRSVGSRTTRMAWIEVSGIVI